MNGWGSSGGAVRGRWGFSLALALFLLVAGGSLLARAWTGGDPPSAAGIGIPRIVATNAHGQQAGYGRAADGSPQAALWEADGTPIPLGTLGGAASAALALNDAGEVVGTAQTTDGAWRAVLWTPAAGPRDLGTLGGRHSRARAFTADGGILGEAQDAAGRWRPVIWADRDPADPARSWLPLSGSPRPAAAPSVRADLAPASAASEAFAAYLYTRFYGRDGEPGGLAFWAEQIDTCAQIPAAVVMEFFRAPEFAAVVAPVARFYFAAFNRIPDGPGLDFWVRLNRAGTDLGVIAAGFVASEEFVARYGAGLDDPTFVEVLYRNVLGREPDSDGRRFWLNGLAAGTPRGQVLLNFSESPENQANTAAEIRVTLAYEGLIGRPPRPFELVGGQAQALDALIADLLQSSVYTGPPAPTPSCGNQAPQVSAGPDQTITLPTRANLSGTVTDDGLPNPPGAVAVTWSRVSGPGTVAFGDASARITTVAFSTAGTYVLRLTADDGALTGSDEVTITVNAAGGGGELPPDPATVAPSINPTVATTTFAATAFLYTGSNPIQTGVAPDTMNPVRVAVLRGQVLDKQNNPLPGVMIAILNHPEFGQTLSRADGQFDLAVNGGGLLTVTYQKTGYLPAQRQVNTPWQDYMAVEDAILIVRDAQATPVNVADATTFQVAQGTPVTDADGTRQATLLIPPGTTAQVYNPDGSTRTVASLTLRATEYTVGDNGPQAMPNHLPPATAYTYAVELSADEGGIKRDGKDVLFNQPVPYYVENFLDVPVGSVVPVGYYDNHRGIWVASDDGRVIKILSITGGLAEVDVNGDDVADTDAALTDLGITDAERQQLATLYPAGKTLWRASLPHLSTWDLNYAWVRVSDVSDDSYKQTIPEPEVSSVPLDNPSCSSGSLIECENQVLGESVPVTGTALTLNYRSDRVPGHQGLRTVRIPVSGPSLPASVVDIELHIRVAGQRHVQRFSPEPNLVHTFTWDGLDGYGQPVFGAQTVSVDIFYRFLRDYSFCPPAENDGTWVRVPNSFGRPAGGLPDCSQEPARTPVDELARTWSATLSARNPSTTDLGGWTLDVHHSYEPVGRVLYQGNGTRQNPSNIVGNGVITVVADSADPFRVHFVPMGMAVGPDGSVWVADFNYNRIRRVGPDGIFTTVAGGGNREDGLGDGGPATAASLRSPNDVAVGPDSSLYIVDDRRIRRVGPDGVITTVAGTGVGGFSGDGGLATAASLDFPIEVAVGPDSSLYIATTGGLNIARIRRVGPDGIITTVAGPGVWGWGYSGNGGPATAARLAEAHGVAIGPDGILYISGLHPIHRVSPALPGFNSGEFAIASTDGRQLYRFSGEGRHLSTLDTLTGATLYTFAYDSAGQLRTITDADGNVTTVERDGNGNPTAIVAPFGQRTALGLDGNGWLASVTNPAGEAHQMQYTADGLLTRFTNPRNHAAQFAYDALGRLQNNTNAAGGSQTLTRTDQPGGYTVTRATGLNRTTAYSVENLPTGDQQRTVTTPDGAITTTLTQTNGTIRVTTPDGAVTETVQGPDPRFGMQAPLVKSLTVTRGGLTATLTTETTSTLSDPNNPLSLTTLTAKTTLNGRESTSLYDAASRITTLTSAAGRASYSVLDAKGRVSEAGLTGLEPVYYSYDARGRLTAITQGSGGDARVSALTYDASGFLVKTTDPLGRETTFANDAIGRILSQTLPDTRQIGFSYDANGNLATLTPPGQPAHGFSYTPIDQVASYQPPTVTPGGDTDYVYNLDRQLTQFTRPDGGAITRDYDAGGRLSTLTTPTGAYGFSYNAARQLSDLTAPGNVALAYSYNQALRTGVAWSGALTGEVGYGYDNDFRVTEITVNSANPIAYQYDADSLLTQAGDLTLTRHADHGLLVGTTLGTVTDSHSYNGFGEPTAYTATATSAALLNIAYTRDPLGRITQKVETVGGATTTYDYGYDVVGQLIEVRQNGAAFASYVYDANGNRLSRTGGGTVNGTYDAQDRLLSYAGATYEYTANGELRSKVQGGQTTTYAYDALGNLRSVALPGGTQIEYLIDGQNRRIGKQVNGALAQGFLYQGQLQPIAELDGSGNVVSRFVYGGGVNVPEYLIKGGQTYRLITDHLGSPRLVVNTATGIIEQRLDYDEFGRVLNDTNPGFQPFGFAGGLYDPDTGLVRFGARDYDAETGRWTAKDPIGFAGGDANLYRYALNDPINFKDPEGKGVADIIIGAVVCGLIAYLASNSDDGGKAVQEGAKAATCGAAGAVLPGAGTLACLPAVADPRDIAAGFTNPRPVTSDPSQLAAIIEEDDAAYP